MNTLTFENYESSVRSYCRNFPAVFSKAKGALMYDEEGQAYIDFFCGAGALSYFMTYERVPQAFADFMLSANLNKWTFILLTNIILLVIGMFIVSGHSSSPRLYLTSGVRSETFAGMHLSSVYPGMRRYSLKVLDGSLK